MPDASGYVERTETLALRKELGSGSYVTGSARCWNRVMVTSMLMLSVQVKGPWLVVGFSVRYGMTDIEADGVGSGEGQIDLDHHGVALVTSMLTLRMQQGILFRVGYSVSGYVERTETLALRKELGSGSDVTGSARCWNRVMVKCEILTKGLGLALVTLKLMATFRDISITERVRFWVLCDGECKMLEQGYGEAWVTSMFQVKCEILTKGLGLALVHYGKI
ncbi:E3 Ubiquitin-Protein Ligase Rnf31 [Manis pentadactyla]|nr:E3 Ubiquitin-Protein Ligase Rnf31 [Manis pentadactyla]